MLPPFPNPVDDNAVRLLAGEVLILNVVAVATQQWWLLPIVAADFVVRALAGPRFSPLAQVARVLRPRLGLGVQPTAGPPKRFAAAIGATLMVAASILALGGTSIALYVVMGFMILFPALETIVGFCAGCLAFGVLMRMNVIPDDVCEACADISARIGLARPQESRPAES